MKVLVFLFLCSFICTSIAETVVPKYFRTSAPELGSESQRALYALALVNSRKKINSNDWVAWPWTIYANGKPIHLKDQVELIRYLKNSPETPYGLFALTKHDFIKNGYSSDDLSLITQPELQVKLVSKHFDAASNQWLNLMATRFAVAKPQPQSQATTFNRVTKGTSKKPNPYNLNQLIAHNAKKYNLPPSLLKAVIRAESAFNCRAVSDAGARGLMQVMPSTARSIGVNPQRLFEPAVSIDAGSKYLSIQIKKFKSLPLALAAYNAGPGAVKKYGNKVPPYKETRNYVKKVQRFAKYYKRLEGRRG